MGWFLQLLMMGGIAGSLIRFVVLSRYEDAFRKLTQHLGPGEVGQEVHQSKNVFQKRVFTFSRLLRKRNVAVRYTVQPGLSSSASNVVELELRLQVVQKFWLRLLTETHTHHPDDEIQTGDQDLDSQYLIHSNQPEAAISFLTNEAIRNALRKTNLCFDRLEFYRGWLRVVFAESVASELRPSELSYLMDAFSDLADHYEIRTPAFRLIVLEQKLCPFCRATLLPENGQVIQCMQCNTKLHEGCWHENGQCTTWGCDSTAAS